ncbi:hypothetical protein KKC13_00835 [bacterium]|nr:hypothetical protein [bacterium]MBU1958940.1 hypothetical protein [bacterium]
MTIEKLPRFLRDVKKITKKRLLTLEQIENTEKLFLENREDKSLRYHDIKCKKDKNRWSITVPNTAYRILVTDLGDVVKFLTLLDHDSYDRINKNC